MKWAVRDMLKFFNVLEVGEITGLENIQKNAIIIANHQSFLDGFIIMGHIPSVPLVKSSYKFNPLFVWVSTLFNFVEISYTPNGITKADEKIRNFLKNGESMLILPEGTRSFDGKIKKFNSLAFKISKEMNIVILPIVLHYSKPIMSKSRESFIFRKKICVKIRILEAIIPQENENTAGLLSRTREVIEKSYLQLCESPL
jgi:1-acyl-sn-glycerol-3-phosphate acyltransferase